MGVPELGSDPKEWKGKLDAMNAQAAQGKAKIVHEPDRTGADAVQRKAHAQGMIKDGHDADHALDIQFGGSATNPANIRSTAARVNRSVGSQGKRRLDYPDGTPIREFVEDK